jgi:hypothetical protein
MALQLWNKNELKYETSVNKKLNQIENGFPGKRLGQRNY